jgi:hypothetical protein
MLAVSTRVLVPRHQSQVMTRVTMKNLMEPLVDFRTTGRKRDEHMTN